VRHRTRFRCWVRLAGYGLFAAAVALAAIGIGIVACSPVPAEAWLQHPIASWMLSRGENPYPVPLVRPRVAPLSAMAQLGRDIFFDPSLSASGRLSCASCHSSQHFYGPPGALPAMRGGPALVTEGVRAVPSLMYLERQPNFSVGPDDEQNESVSLAGMAALAQQASRTRKTAQDTAATAANLVPQGGLFWDGRADTLQGQAMFPLLSQFEMDGGTIDRVAAKLRGVPYAYRFVQLFGPAILASRRMLVDEAMFAVARFEIEDRRFHLYTSKYDFWLEGKARLSFTELRGYLLFNDPKKADCAGCHLDQSTPDGRPPLFTDHQYEALGVPRNPALAANHDPAYFDLGICGPDRGDMRSETQYCGLFATPTLRNVATRQVFFHNGVYHSLQQVLDFYDFRDTDPTKIYPRAADGRIDKFNDLPRRYRANIDITDPPFDRNPGDPLAMTAADERDIIAFLKTLTDGWHP
jgi:cytochrome c peroxidase